MNGLDRRALAGALAALVAAAVPAVARADKAPVAVLWLETPKPEVAQAVAQALADSPSVRPIDDAEARRLLVEGGPEARVSERLAAGREQLAALHMKEADAALAQAEQIALVELRAAEACPRLVEIERLRVRYAELLHDEAAARAAVRWLAACSPSPTGEDAAAIARHGGTATPAAPASATASASPARAQNQPAPTHAPRKRHFIHRDATATSTPTPTAAPAPSALAAVRVESDPPGADVLLDLRPIGKTPLELPPTRRPGALVDVELAGYRKVHRVAPDAGTLAVALARDDRLAELVDRIRAAHGDAAAADLAELGRRVGASRVLVIRAEPGAAERLQARLFDVASASWPRAGVSVAAAPVADAAARLAAESASVDAGAPKAATANGAPAQTAPPATGATAQKTSAAPGAAAQNPSATPPAGAPKSAPPPSLAAKATQKHNAATEAREGPPDNPVTLGDGSVITVPASQDAAKASASNTQKPSAWKKWYTWVAGGALIVGVGAFVIAQHVGDDQVTIDVSH